MTAASRSASSRAVPLGASRLPARGVVDDLPVRPGERATSRGSGLHHRGREREVAGSDRRPPRARRAAASISAKSTVAEPGRADDHGDAASRSRPGCCPPSTSVVRRVVDEHVDPVPSDRSDAVRTTWTPLGSAPQARGRGPARRPTGSRRCKKVQASASRDELGHGRPVQPVAPATHTARVMSEDVDVGVRRAAGQPGVAGAAVEERLLAGAPAAQLGPQRVGGRRVDGRHVPSYPSTTP